MSKPILFALASVIVLAAAGCNGGDSGAGATGTPPPSVAPVVNGPKSGSPGKAGSATVGLNPNADPERFAPGTKGGTNSGDK